MGPTLRPSRRRSARSFWPLPDQIVVLPGHGPHTTLGVEKKTNRLFQDFARRGRGEQPVARPWVGIQLDTTHTGPGLHLLQVVERSPAAAAGLRAGDVILALDGVTLGAPQDLLGVIDQHAVGDAEPLVYLRGTERRQGTLTFRARSP